MTYVRDEAVQRNRRRSQPTGETEERETGLLWTT